jgi:hypothetical protein
MPLGGDRGPHVLVDKVPLPSHHTHECLGKHGERHAVGLRRGRASSAKARAGGRESRYIRMPRACSIAG